MRCGCPDSKAPQPRNGLVVAFAFASGVDRVRRGMADRVVDLRYFHYALVTAEQGSFRRAAALLGFHPTQVGWHIRALKDRLGSQMLDRSSTAR